MAILDKNRTYFCLLIVGYYRCGSWYRASKSRNARVINHLYGRTSRWPPQVILWVTVARPVFLHILVYLLEY